MNLNENNLSIVQNRIEKFKQYQVNDSKFNDPNNNKYDVVDDETYSIAQSDKTQSNIPINSLSLLNPSVKSHQHFSNAQFVTSTEKQLSKDNAINQEISGAEEDESVNNINGASMQVNRLAPVNRSTGALNINIPPHSNKPPPAFSNSNESNIAAQNVLNATDSHYDEDDDDEGEIDQNLCQQGNESTGRWTRAEHELFVKALKLFGKEWKKVAAMVKTRTVVQTRTHAQKYFQKLSKVGTSGRFPYAGNGMDFGNETIGNDLVDVSLDGNFTFVDAKTLHTNPSQSKNLTIKFKGSNTNSSGAMQMNNQLYPPPQNKKALKGPKLPSQSQGGSASKIQLDQIYSLSNIHPGSSLFPPPMLHRQLTVPSEQYDEGNHHLSNFDTKNRNFPFLQTLVMPASYSNHHDMLRDEHLQDNASAHRPETMTPQIRPYTTPFNYYSGRHISTPEADSSSGMNEGKPQDISFTPLDIKHFDTANYHQRSAPQPPPDFSQPSPAASGKRKHAELKVAHLLALSSASVDEGIQLLSSMKTEASSDGNSFSSSYGFNMDETTSTPSIDRHRDGNADVSSSADTLPLPRKPRPPSLSITNPNYFMESSEGLHGNEMQASTDQSNSELVRQYTPSTPWEKGIRAMDATIFQPNLSRSVSFDTNSYFDQGLTDCNTSVATASERKTFLSNVKELVLQADLAGLTQILNAAEYSALAYIKNKEQLPSQEDSNKAPGTEENLTDLSRINNSVSVSNLISTFTPPSEIITAPAIHPFKKTPGTTLVAKSLNRTNKKELSILMIVVSVLDLKVHDQNLIHAFCALLIEHGASAALVDKSDNTCLHYAAERGYDRVGRLLIAKGCPMNGINSDGNSAAHIAAKFSKIQFLEMLAEFGANFHLRNRQGYSALDVAGMEQIEIGKSEEDQVTLRESLRKDILIMMPRLRTLILYHEDCLEHRIGRPSDWEGPDRLLGIMKQLRNQEEFKDYEVEISNQFEKAGVELLQRAHSPKYIQLVNTLSKQLQEQAENTALTFDTSLPPPPPPAIAFTPHVQKHIMRQSSEEVKQPEKCDTFFTVGTLNAARRAAGAVAHAVDCVLLGRNRNAFCVVRPPGHHAGYQGLLNGSSSCGFCIFNNVAAGALYALEEKRCERVAIIDIDIHHGNGTEDIVRHYQHPSRLFFFSLHLFEKTEIPSVEFFPGSGGSDDYLHNIINVPLPPLWQSPHHTSRNSKKPPSETSTDPTSTDQDVKKDNKKGSNSSDESNSVTSNTKGTGKRSGYSTRNADQSRKKEMKTSESNSVHTASTKLDTESIKSDENPAVNQVRLRKDLFGGPKVSTNTNAAIPMLYGREGYRQAISQRLIPSLRAFNPDLILVSTGFDPAAGDVGNIRNYPGQQPEKGMDLLPEDFAWTTTEIIRIADICCQGRVVSVLEGGYGEYDMFKLRTEQQHATRSSTVNRGFHPPAPRKGKMVKPTVTRAPLEVSEANFQTAIEHETHNSMILKQSAMNRDVLANAAAAHVRSLIDPYKSSFT